MKTTINTVNEELSALVAKAKTGDQAAFTELYDRTAPELYRCIRAMTRDEDLTWDIQQDAYLKAYQSLDTLENNEAFFPWLRRIAVNGTVSHMRKQHSLSFTELASGEDDDATPELPDLNVDNQPELSLDRKETSRLMQEILSKLPEAQQLIVGMHYYDELSVKEIADSLHLSTGAVKAQLFHGRKKIETAVRALEKQGVKLYGLSPVAFLVALMRRMEPAQAAKATAVKSAVAKAAANSLAVSAAAKPVTALTFSEMLKGSVGKILIGALSVAVIGGGIWAGGKLLKRDQPSVPKQPTETVNAVLLSYNSGDSSDETPEDVTEPVVYVTVPAEDTTAPTETAEQPSESAEPSESTEPTEPDEQDALSGSCGEHLTWRFDPETGLLTIEGSGEMDDADGPADELGRSTMPWYRYRDAITSINLPDGLTSISDNAFSFCEALTNVIIPDSVTRIGLAAFSECTALTYVSIPDSVESIGEEAFSLTKLKSVTIPGSVKTIGVNAFRECALSNVVIGNGVTSIERYAFAGNANLSSVTIPDSVTSVGERAFHECDHLDSVTIPSSVTNIGAYAFGFAYGFVGTDYTDVAMNGFSISGVAGSAAERYATENGFAFVPLDAVAATDLDVILQRQAQDRENPSETQGWTRITEVNHIGDRYLAKVVRTVAVSVPKAELEQAKQAGSITLNGQEYRIPASQEQLNEWMGWEESYCSIDEMDGVIVGNGNYYFISEIDGTYYFYKEIGGIESRIETVANEDWVWLDGDMKLEQYFDHTEYTLASYLQSNTISQNVRAEFIMEENGDVYIGVDPR